MNASAPHYHRLLDTSKQMAQAAAAGRWALVGDLESLIARQWEHVRQIEKASTLPIEAKKGKQAALLALLRYDAQIRSLAEPGWNRLDAVLKPNISVLHVRPTRKPQDTPP